MEKLILILLAPLFSCKVDLTAEEKLNALQPPVIVVSTGSFMGDCLIKVQDSNNKILNITDNHSCDLKKGDTLMYKRK